MQKNTCLELCYNVNVVFAYNPPGSGGGILYNYDPSDSMCPRTIGTSRTFAII